MKIMPYLTKVIHEYNLLIREPNLRFQFIDKGFAMTDLCEMKCVACRAGEPTVTNSEIEMLQPQIPEWQVKDVDGIKRLERVFKFKKFAEALEFTNKVGAIAEEENHHPLVVTEYERTTIEWWTHAINGLQKNDFIMAAKTDELL